VGRQVGRVGGRVARGVGQVARTVAPIASMIPLPQAQAVGRIAGLLGRVMADGGDEFDALEDLFDLAEDEDAIDAAAPIIAGLTVRQRMPGVARATPQVRRQMVRGVTQATRTLARRQGPQAARAVPGVVQTVQRAGPPSGGSAPPGAAGRASRGSERGPQPAGGERHGSPGPGHRSGGGGGSEGGKPSGGGAGSAAPGTAAPSRVHAARSGAHQHPELLSI
jgi:hypothetical protein